MVDKFLKSKEQGLLVLALIPLLLIMVMLGGLGVYLWHLDAVVRAKFEGHRWALPAKVYARPMELYVGSELTQQDVLGELNRLHYQSGTAATPGTYVASANQLIIHLRGFLFPDEPVPEQVVRVQWSATGIASLASTVSDQTLVRMDPMIIGGIYPQQNEDRILMQLKDAPQGLIPALLATEDRNFYHHHGVSVRGTLRAVTVDLLHGQLRQGGSTLTQQLVKNFYLSDERTLRRKLQEMAMALLLELHYSKQEILQTYLNEVSLGQAGQHSIHGFGLAAQYYFGQPIQDLNLPQIALLVGVVKGPSHYDPRLHPHAARLRRNIVLANMLNEQVISRAQYSTYVQLPISVIRHPNASGTWYPAFMDVVRRQLHQDYKDADLESQGLRIFTTLDPRVQDAAQSAMNQVIKQLRARGRRLARIEGAALVSNPQNGELLAVLGGSDLQFTGYDRALDSSRQVGSLLKPAIYLTALASHHDTLATLLDNSPLTLAMANGSTWSPHNYEADAPASVTLIQALAHSYNLASVRLGMSVGLPAVITTLHNLGLQQDIPAYPSTLLGAITLTPWQVLGMYQTLVSNGFETPVRSIREVVDGEGKPLSRYDLDVRQVVDASAVYLLRQAMHQVMVSGTAAAASAALPQNTDMLGKTGTTNDLRDAWFAGATGNKLAVVWLGNDNNQPTGLSGATGALPVWIDLMRQLHPRPIDTPQPDNVAWVWVDPEHQAITTENCPGALMLPFFKDTLPTSTLDCQAAGASPVLDHMLDKIKGFFGR